MTQTIYPQVSVIITAYNHEKYLGQCLESIVSQITDFPFEIVVGEDCSTDGTRNILKKFAENYSELIVPIYYEQNQGTKACPGKGNFTNTFYKCRGKYIVYIEGDDYLTSNNKLQIQYDFLNKNPESSACFHNGTIIYDNNLLPPAAINPVNQKQKIYPEDLLYDKEVWFMATASVMFRRNLIPEKFPDWFLKCKSGDIPMYCMLANQGYIGYIPENMCVYRKHEAGLSFTDIHHDTVFIDNRLFMYKSINEFTNFKYDKLIKNIIAKYYLDKADSIQHGNSAISRLGYTLKSISISKPKSIFETLKKYAISKENYDKYLGIRRKLNGLLGK
jgi:glycosyltransferase involved in cell wall biosynthesis